MVPRGTETISGIVLVTNVADVHSLYGSRKYNVSTDPSSRRWICMTGTTSCCRQRWRPICARPLSPIRHIGRNENEYIAWMSSVHCPKLQAYVRYEYVILPYVDFINENKLSV